MLEVKNITKVYKTEGFTQKALDGVSVNFRKSEFASILGPSGSGKEGDYANRSVDRRRAGC